MSKTQLSFKQMQEFEAVAANYLANNGYIENGQFTKKENTKLTAALRNVIKQIGKHYEEMNDEIDNIRIRHASVDDKTKVLLRDDKGNYQYTPDKLIELKVAIKNYRSSEQRDIHQRFVDDIPVDLTEEEVEVFKSIVIE